MIKYSYKSIIAYYYKVSRIITYNTTVTFYHKNIIMYY